MVNGQSLVGGQLMINDDLSMCSWFMIHSGLAMMVHTMFHDPLTLLEDCLINMITSNKSVRICSSGLADCK